MPVLDAIQIFLISLVLLVGLINLYLSHISKPKSEIVLNAEVSSRSEAKHMEGEFDYWLYFHANNRGDDNGYVTSAELLRLKFFDEDEPNGVNTLEGRDLEDGVYGQMPLVILQRERENERNERGALLVKEGDVDEILVVLRVFSGELVPLVQKYDHTRAVLEFEMVDSERKYTEVCESEAVRTRELVPHWVDEDPEIVEEQD